MIRVVFTTEDLRTEQLVGDYVKSGPHKHQTAIPILRKSTHIIMINATQYVTYFDKSAKNYSIDTIDKLIIIDND